MLGESKILTTPIGLAIFMNKGMTGWVKAWIRMDYDDTVKTNKSMEYRSKEIPEIVQNDLTILLADMVCQIKEVNCEYIGESKD